MIAVSRKATKDGGWVATYEDISERRATEARLAHLARHDGLTGLPNRLMFSEHITSCLARVRRGGAVALLCLDLDRFKLVNDTMGHAAGDKLLRAVAQRLRECTRETDLVVRFGGDEFVIVQESPPACLPRHRRWPIAWWMSSASRSRSTSRKYRSASASALPCRSDGLETGEALLQRADLAIYRAKNDAEGTFRFFEREMDEAMQVRRALEVDLRRALAERSFEVYYQPLVQPTGIAGFEALLRWRHPQRGHGQPRRLHSNRGRDTA